MDDDPGGDSPGRGTGAVPPPALDLLVDAHVHTGFATGRGAVTEYVTAAERAGLAGLTFGDLAGPETTWLPAYLHAVRRAQHRTDLVLHAAVEVEVVRHDGWLAFPADLAELEAVSVVLCTVPMPAGRLSPGQARAAVAAGTLHPQAVVAAAVEASIRAVERASRYAPTRLARPLSVLTAAGIDESEVSQEQLRALAAGCRATRTEVEVSEAWRTPSPRLARELALAGVRLVVASDATDAGQVGRWRYVQSVRSALAGLAGAA